MTSTLAAPPHTRQVVVRTARNAFAGTPGRLRLAGIATVLACMVFILFAFVAATTRANALASARADAAQLVRVQSIRTNLVFADAKVLGNVNQVITRYTGLVESARANNRLGYPLGAAYLRQATNLLRTDALPPLAALGQIEQARVNQHYSDSAGATAWLVAGLVIALVVLLVAQVWLSVRTRRTFNPPLVIATALVLVIGIAVAGVLAWSQGKAKDTRGGAYFATLGLATAR